VVFRRDNDAALAKKDAELATSHELNSKLRDDYELLEERFKKQTKMSDEFLAQLKHDMKSTVETNKQLQEFKEKYDKVLTEERSANSK